MAAGREGERPGIDESDGFVCFTITQEGISNTILEAMATGLPVVATNTRRQSRACES